MCSNNNGDDAQIAVPRAGRIRRGWLVPYVNLFIALCVLGLLVTCALLL